MGPVPLVGPMHSVDPPGEPPETRLKDLRAGLPPVHVLGRVVTVSRREITGKTDGRRRPVLSGLLSDGTATVRFTWWDPPSEGVDRGTVLRAVNAQVREFRARAELSFGWSTRIQPASDLELPSLHGADLPLHPINQLGPGAEGFRLEVRVVDIAERTVSIGEDRRTIHSGHFADGSGSAPFTAWVDFRLKSGDTVRVAGGYVRIFRGVPEVILDERTHVEPISPQAVSAPPSPPEPLPLTLGGLEARGGGAETSTEGLVVGLGSPSGVVGRCPTCARILHDGVCRLHGAVTGIPDLRARILLDDGTGVATVHLPRDLTEQLTTQTLAQLADRMRAGTSPLTIEEEFRRKLVGRRLRVTGRSRVDEFGLALFPSACREVHVDSNLAVDTLSRRLAGRPR